MADSSQTRATLPWLANPWRGSHEDQPSLDAQSPHPYSAQKAQSRSGGELQSTQVENVTWWSPGRGDSSDERTPLLQRNDNMAADIQCKTREYHLHTRLREVGTLLSYAGPAFISNFLEYSLVMAPIVSIGHISTTALAAGTLASMTANVSGLIIAQSFASALDTMLPPAWTSSDPSLVGLWTQRMFVVMFLVNIPMLVVWLCSERILLALRQEPQIASLAGLYLRTLSIGLPAYSFNQILRRFFQCQGLFSVPTKIIAIVAPVNAGLNILFVWGPERTRLGFAGAPLATAISFNLMFALSIIYLVWLLPSRQACRKFTSDAFRGLGTLFYLGTAGVAQTASEWFAWEVMTIAASFINETSLAAESILIVTCTTTWQAAYAIAMSTSVRTGNLLGEGDAVRARLVSRLSLVIATVVALFWCAMFIGLREQLAYLFNDDIEVVSIVVQIMPLVAFLQLLDGISTLSSGILRSCGRQGIAAVIIFCSYYVVGIPAALALCFKSGLGLAGLWYGLSLGYVCSTALQLCLLWSFDWNKEAKAAQQRLHDSVPGTPDSEETLN